MIVIHPGKFLVGEIGGDTYISRKVRSCVAVVIESPTVNTGMRAMLHYNGNRDALTRFLHMVNQQIPQGIVKLSGAASFVPSGPINLDHVLASLDELGLEVVAQEVFGEFERVVTTSGVGTFSHRREYNPFYPSPRNPYAALEDRENVIKL